MLSLRREKSTELFYNLHRKISRSPETWILQNYFQENTWAITENVFPYIMEPGLSNYILWIAPKTTCNYKDAKQIVQKWLGHKEFTLLLNKKSYMCIQHYHIICKKTFVICKN